MRTDVSLLNPKMKTNITPLCPEHLVEMVPGRMKTGFTSREIWDEPGFRCSQPECHFSFEPGGYFLRDGCDCWEGSKTFKAFVNCEHRSMFLERVEGECLTWRCSVEGCDRSRVTNRAMEEVPNPAAGQEFLGHAGTIPGGPPDLSSRKGYSQG